jgi:hypothetical protein
MERQFLDRVCSSNFKVKNRDHSTQRVHSIITSKDNTCTLKRTNMSLEEDKKVQTEEDTIKAQTTAESPSSELESEKEKMMNEGNTSIDWSSGISMHVTRHTTPPSLDDSRDSDFDDSFAMEDDEDPISESQTEAKDT